MRLLFLLALLLVPCIFLACRQDCRETLRTADFEFSQGNYVRAEKLYGDALKADPARCADAEGKRTNARRFLGR